MSPQDEVMQPVSATTETRPDAKPLPSDALIVVPVRDLVLFPEMVFPVSVGRPSSVAAIQQAVREQRQILLVLQRDPAKEELAPADLHAVGTVVNILRYVTTPDGNHHIVCQGVQRFRITEVVEGYPFLLARGLHLAEPTGTGPEIEARFLVLKQQIRDTLELLPQVPQELRQTVESTTSAGALADLAASYLDSKPEEKQEIEGDGESCSRSDRRSASTICCSSSSSCPFDGTGKPYTPSPPTSSRYSASCGAQTFGEATHRKRSRMLLESATTEGSRCREAFISASSQTRKLP